MQVTLFASGKEVRWQGCAARTEKQDVQRCHR